jgi:DNA-binding response OmpR family regulator
MSEEKILVVDDDRSIRVLLSQCLEEAGYKVTSAIDGSQALQKVKEDTFDLILLDMKLPDIDGLQVLKDLLNINSEQIVVIITAYGTIETAVEAMKLGASDYLQKPFTPEEILAIVQHNLTKRTVFRPEKGESYEEYLIKARKLLKELHSEEAIRLIREAISLEPENPEAFNLLGAAEEYRGNIDGARRMYRVAVTLDPSYKPSTKNLDRVTSFEYDNRSGLDLGESEEEKLGGES